MSIVASTPLTSATPAAPSSKTALDREYEYLIRRAKKNGDEKLAKQLQEKWDHYRLDAATRPS